MIPVPRLLRVLATLCVVVLFAACSNDPSSAATVGETGEISIDQLHADVALFGFLTKLSGAPCGTPVGNETQESACARFALANDIHEELAKSLRDRERREGRSRRRRRTPSPSSRTVSAAPTR